MSDIVLVPSFPRREHLVWFFRARPAVTVDQAGSLLGWPETQVRSRAESDGVPLSGERVSFDDVAFWLLDVWPRARLLETLGSAAEALPRDLHLTRAPWQLPRYIVRAMQKQAELQLTAADVEHELTVHDYMTHLLHLAILPETVAALGGDEDFMAAFDYPQGEDG